MAVDNPWIALPTAPDQRRRLERAHETAVATGAPSASGPVSGLVPGVRSLVRESWERSLRQRVDPDAAPALIDFGDEELRAYRNAHPLAGVLPVIHRLLIRHTFEASLIVAIGDQAGRLLWIDGDRDLRRQAETMAFMEGANWSEAAVGTSAPGTALALDHGIQIHQAEHFSRIVHPWSCTAVPVHDPESGAVLGVIDLTGGEDAVDSGTLPLLEATVAAVEAELRIRRLTAVPEREPAPRRRSAPAAAPSSRAVADPPLLRVLGRQTGLLEVDGRAVELSERHAEILALLAWHPQGLSAEQLSEALHGRPDAAVTLRAEMVRLRRILERQAPRLVPLSRPYRVPVPLELDAHRVLSFLNRGAHRVALGGYPGPVMPGSTAPGIEQLRREVGAQLRETLLEGASVDTLLDYARSDEAALDRDLWQACLRLLPPKSPRRASVVARIEWIDEELGRS